jgi:UDP-N-acetylglucosamine acyltransferase
MAIHPTAIVDARARIAEGAEIGPYCIIGSGVDIGAGTRLMAHVYVEGVTKIGDDNLFYPYSTMGVASQDLKYQGESSETRIGNRNKIREFVTIHRGTEGGGLITEIGDDNLVMAYSHIAHDVRIGNHTVLSNGATCGGHVVIGDWAVIGAFSGVHQYCRVGRHAMIGGYSVITQDWTGTARLHSGGDRRAPQSLPAAGQVWPQHHPGGRSNQQRSGDGTGDRRTPRIHRFF